MMHEADIKMPDRSKKGGGGKTLHATSSIHYSLELSLDGDGEDLGAGRE